MAIFGVLETDLVVQVNEKVRLDASKTFVTNDEADITLVEIKPSAADAYITVFSTVGAELQENWFLDWSYSAAAATTASVRITTNAAPVVFTKDFTVVSVATDALFASDDDLKTIESDIMKWLPAGKSTWNFTHRKVQQRILTEIYKSRILGTDYEKLTKAEFLDISEVREWATYMALSMIYGSIQNAVDDVFMQKSKKYEAKSNEYQQYTFNILRADYNRDGNITETEKLDFRSGGLIRR